MEINQYINNLYNFQKKEDEIEKFIISFAEKENIPYLKTEKAKLLAFFTKLKNPHKCFEIGLGSGFSTYNILKSLKKNSTLISIDSNFFRVDLFYYNIYNKLPLSLKKKLSVYPVDSFYIIDKFIETRKKFDLIFLDATKKDYRNYYETLPLIMSKNGILIIDNITYLKQTFKLETKRSKNYLDGVKSIEEANKILLNISGLETIFLPVDDGLSLSIKLQD